VWYKPLGSEFRRCRPPGMSYGFIKVRRYRECWRPNSASVLKYGPADVAEMEIEWRSAAFVDESLRELPGVFYTSFQGMKSLVLKERSRI